MEIHSVNPALPHLRNVRISWNSNVIKEVTRQGTGLPEMQQSAVTMPVHLFADCLEIQRNT